MDEQEIEQALRRFQPAGPTEAFRHAVSRRPRAMPWAATAAALLVAVVLLRAGMERQIEQFPPDEPSAEALGLNLLAETLGGGAEARRMAELLVQQDTIRQVMAMATVDRR